MSYNFYVLEGKKLINYKPTEKHYQRALVKFGETFAENPEYLEKNKDKMLFLLIKIMGKEKRDIKKRYKKQENDFVYGMFAILQVVENLVSEYTPREFMRLFPIQKDYDGEKYGVKDYFYCMDYINRIGIDKPIGEKASEFLMEYWNWDINHYMVTWMSVVSAMDIIQTGRDSMMDFFEENGLHFRTMHQEGVYMVDDETGERFEIKKPKSHMRKLFTVV